MPSLPLLSPWASSLSILAPFLASPNPVAPSSSPPPVVRLPELPFRSRVGRFSPLTPLRSNNRDFKQFATCYRVESTRFFYTRLRAD